MSVLSIETARINQNSEITDKENQFHSFFFVCVLFNSSCVQNSIFHFILFDCSFEILISSYVAIIFFVYIYIEYFSLNHFVYVRFSFLLAHRRRSKKKQTKIFIVIEHDASIIVIYCFCFCLFSQRHITRWILMGNCSLSFICIYVSRTFLSVQKGKTKPLE